MMNNMPGTRGPINRHEDDLNRTRFLGSEVVAGTSPKAERALQSPEEKSRRVLGNALTFDEAERALTYLEGDVVDAKGKQYSKEYLQGAIADIKTIVEGGHPVSPDFLASAVPNVLGLPEAVRKIAKFAGEMMQTPEQEVAVQEQVALAREEETQRLFTKADTFNDIRSVLQRVKGIKNGEWELSQEALLEMVQYVDEATLTAPEGEISSYIEKSASGLGFRDALRRAYQQKRRLALHLPATKPQEVVTPVKVAAELPMIDRKSLIEDKSLPVKQRLRVVQTFDELGRVMQDSVGISGSQEWFSPFELLRRIQSVKEAVMAKNYQAVAERMIAITSGEGLKEAVARVIENALRTQG